MKATLRNLRLLAAFAAALGGVLIGIPIVLILGPLAEPLYMPVVRDVRIQRQHFDGRAVVFEVVGIKARACTYLGASALAGNRTEFMEAINIDFPRSAVPGVTKPTGEQSFGTWRVQPVQRDDRVRIQLRHQCHSLWDITTQLGPWAVLP